VCCVCDECKDQAIPVQASTGSLCSMLLRVPLFKTISTWRW